MRFILVLFAGYVLLYAPGHYLLRRAESAPGDASRLLREVLLSACCTSWLGLLLAELGWFSLPLLLALLAGLAFLGSRFWRGVPRRGYGLRDAGGLALWLLACVWIAPPLDTHLVAADSSGYLASGLQLARHGTLVMHDPSLAHLSVDTKRALFPSVAPERGLPPYLRVNGSLILRRLDSDEVLPAFHHAITVWIGAADAVAGVDAGAWIITVFGGLSVWAIVECAALLGASMGLVLPLLLLSAVQYWYSRFLMPEVPGQFFLWAGLACVATHERSARASDAAMAGFAFGIAGLVRTENAIFLLVTLVIGALLVAPAARHRYALLLACAAVVWLHAGIHLAVFRTHYFGILRGLLDAWRPALNSPRGLGILFAVGTTALLVWRAHRRAAPAPSPARPLSAGAGWGEGASLQRVSPAPSPFAFPRGKNAREKPASANTTETKIFYGLLFFLLLLSLWAGCRNGFSSLGLLRSCVGLPTLVGGGAGLLLLLRHGDTPPLARQLLVFLTALVFAQVMISPHAQPIPIWAARRALTVLLPAACIGLALLCRAVAQRWQWTAAALLFCGGLLGEGRLLWQMRSEVDYYRGAARHVQAIAALIEPGATVLVDGQLVGSHLAPALWAGRDLPTYLLAAADTERIAEVVSMLGAGPLYWIGSGGEPLPHGPGIQLTPVALYEFVITTPNLDVGAPLGSAASWELPIAVYRLRGGTNR